MRNERIFFALLCTVTGLLAGCTAERRQHATTARSLLHEAIQLLAEKPLGRERVDWKQVEAELAWKVASDAPPTAAYPLIQAAVARLADPHARFFPKPDASVQPPSPPPNDSSDAPTAARGEIPYAPAARLLPSHIAYVVVPICNAGSLDELQQYATNLRTAILAMEARDPAAWLIELRFNGGGNVWPMLIGIRPILGDGLQLTGIDSTGVLTKIGCDGVVSWLQRGDAPRQTQLEITPPAGDRLIGSRPVAVLVGPWTMSAGEMLAIALQNRPRTRLFGEPTAGLTTATEEFLLSDGSRLILSVETMGNRAGAPVHGAIQPDFVVDCDDWPGPDDTVARAAIQWLLSETTEGP